MSFSSCFSHSPLVIKNDHLGQPIRPCGTVLKWQPFPIISNGAGVCNQRIARSRVNLTGDWSFIGGSRVVVKPNSAKLVHHPKSCQVHASFEAGGSLIMSLCFYIASSDLLSIRPMKLSPGFSGSQLVSSAFTLGTVAVLPFYTLMVVAPKSELTKKCMESSIPYVVLGILYAYLLFLSWTPETVRLIFASKYLLPELTSIGKMFSSEFTLASAWIHLLVVDLFAARHVFQDGLENQIETRHSVSFCLFFCPIGILAHVITKAMTKTTRKEGHGL